MRAEGSRRTVLVTGGTRGLGRAVGLAFARTGARVVLTHRWGSADPSELAAAFESEGASAPEVVAADVADPDDTGALLDHIGGPLDVFVSNVTVVGRGDGTLSPRDLRRSLDYSAWPLLRYVEAMEERLGSAPPYVVAMSSDGAERFYPGYDYVAASKSVMESLCAQLARRRPDMRINALRARQVDTGGYREMFGQATRDVVARFARFDVEPDEVARVAVALCSGDLDGLSGEVVTVDRGASPLDNLVNVAPALLGGIALWEEGGAGASTESSSPSVSERRAPRDRRVLWVDAGVAPAALDFCRPLQVVTPAEAATLDPDRIPEAVVVGSDWRGRADDDTHSATVLLELVGRAAKGGTAPRYGVRLERGVDAPLPGEALGRTLDRYWGGWHVAHDSRLNCVRYTDDGHHEAATAAVRALISGGLDGVRGQVLNVSRGVLS